MQYQLNMPQPLNPNAAAFFGQQNVYQTPVITASYVPYDTHQQSQSSSYYDSHRGGRGGRGGRGRRQ